MNLTIVAGARPNFMKVAPVIRALRNIDIEPRLIHTGQHYDECMSATFFQELHIPEPDASLGVGSGDALWQTAELMHRIGLELREHRPDAVVVVGDVNSTVAAALAASKLEIPVAHVEAGLRSFDRDMPEELNRLVTDALSTFLFTSEPSADENLARENVSPDRIFAVGNVMIDTLFSRLSCARALCPAARLGLTDREYIVVTLHRQSNVDDPERLESILKALSAIADHLPIVFPVHPRTRMRLREFGFDCDSISSGIMAVEPQGYLSMLGLVDAARLVMTDSGGVQEETTALRVPCLTLRENTERPITVEIGSNTIVGWRTHDIVAAALDALEGPERIGRVPKNWDGHAAERIAAALSQHVPCELPPTDDDECLAEAPHEAPPALQQLRTA
ncbi:MAG TPA: UDP-N-acetylglucosamine 2-epimerase (non-hydrolyzing) [Planctomycetaceae bacterium]|jgi:UDP-N-acetylglucosamine 2-epimerase (non-hydrolysing)